VVDRGERSFSGRFREGVSVRSPTAYVELLEPIVKICTKSGRPPDTYIDDITIEQRVCSDGELLS